LTAALIGHTGFVGGYLAKCGAYDLLLNRTNIESLRGQRLDRLVCAGLPAAKWLANRDPEGDCANMRALADVLGSVETRGMILISTIDVYPRTRDADEDFDCGSAPNHAYGAHRLEFEQFVRDRFPDALILRLPALFGPGLRKNAIYDLLHGNQLELVNPASSFQWYPLTRLPADLERAAAARLGTVNLFTAPLNTRQIIEQWFPHLTVGAQAGAAAFYDLHTRHAAVFGGEGRYLMSEAAVLEALDRFFAAEMAA
jgi:hypothetical protein